jgi:hypothetical protein
MRMDGHGHSVPDGAMAEVDVVTETSAIDALDEGGRLIKASTPYMSMVRDGASIDVVEDVALDAQRAHAEPRESSTTFDAVGFHSATTMRAPCLLR